MQETRAEQEMVGTEEPDVIHIWCNWCDTQVRKAMCGEDLLPHKEAKHNAKVDCPMCLELEDTHLKAFHLG